MRPVLLLLLVSGLIVQAASVSAQDEMLLALEAAEVAPDVGQDAAALLHRALPAHRTVLALPGGTAYPAPDGSDSPLRALRGRLS